MKKVSFIGMLLILVMSCKPSELLIEQTLEESDETDVMITYHGTYESTAGVMTIMSCYCDLSGVFTTSQGETINVCFGLMGKEPQNGTHLTIQGHMMTMENDPEPTSPCKKGEITFFMIDHFQEN